MSEEVNASPEKKFSKGKLIALAIVAVVVVVAIVVGVSFYKNYTAPKAQLERAEAAGMLPTPGHARGWLPEQVDAPASQP